MYYPFFTRILKYYRALKKYLPIKPCKFPDFGKIRKYRSGKSRLFEDQIWKNLSHNYLFRKQFVRIKHSNTCSYKKSQAVDFLMIFLKLHMIWDSVSRAGSFVGELKNVYPNNAKVFLIAAYFNHIFKNKAYKLYSSIFEIQFVILAQ